MYFFINELSFIGQARDIHEARSFIMELYSIIKAIKPLQQDKPVQTHSGIANEKICSDLTFYQWLTDNIKSTSNHNRTVASVLLKILSKGPFIDKQKDLNFYQCYFGSELISPSSLLGAAYHRGVLVSLQNSPCFSNEVIKVKFGYEKQEFQDIEITNLIKINQVNKIRRCYKPSPKHRQRGEQGIKGTKMDLSDEDAQVALDEGISHNNGRKIYSYYKKKYYEFKSDNAGYYHGYPILEKEVPSEVIKELKKSYS